MRVFIFVLFPKMKEFIFCDLPHGSIILRPQDESFHLCALPQDEVSSYMQLPKMKVFILYATPRGKGSHLLCSSPRWRFELAPYNYFLSVYGWAIGFIYYKSIVIIVVALKVHLLISDSDHDLQLYLWYCFYRVLNRYRLMIPYDWHHRCVLLLGGYRLWVWYNACQPCQGRIDQGGRFALIHHVAFLSQFLL